MAYCSKCGAVHLTNWAHVCPIPPVSVDPLIGGATDDGETFVGRWQLHKMLAAAEYRAERAEALLRAAVGEIRSLTEFTMLAADTIATLEHIDAFLAGSAAPATEAKDQP